MAERFHLKFHRELKQMSGYALVVAKSGRPDLVYGDTAVSFTSQNARMLQRTRAATTISQMYG
jgi:uncharacterized protein (TIGR03435 family)